MPTDLIGPNAAPRSEPSFREYFCANFHCREDRYEQEALKFFLHKPWARLAALILRLRPSFLMVDRQIVRRIGNMNSSDYVRDEVRDIRSDYQRADDFGFARQRLRLRLSGARILDRACSFWPGHDQPPQTAAKSPAVPIRVVRS